MPKTVDTLIKAMTDVHWRYAVQFFPARPCIGPGSPTTNRQPHGAQSRFILRLSILRLMPHARRFRGFLIDPTNQATGKHLPSVALTSLLYSDSSAALRRQGDEVGRRRTRDTNNNNNKHEQRHAPHNTHNTHAYTQTKDARPKRPLRCHAHVGDGQPQRFGPSRFFATLVHERGPLQHPMAPFLHRAPHTATFAYACATHIANFYWHPLSTFSLNIQLCCDYLTSASSASAAHCATSASPFRYYHAS
jgi:hypothetical protein